MAKHADAELMLMLESTAPPVDIHRIGIFRAPVAKHEKEADIKSRFEFLASEWL